CDQITAQASPNHRLIKWRLMAFYILDAIYLKRLATYVLWTSHTADDYHRLKRRSSSIEYQAHRQSLTKYPPTCLATHWSWHQPWRGLISLLVPVAMSCPHSTQYPHTTSPQR